MKEGSIFKGILISMLFTNAFCISNHPLLLIVSFDGFRYDYLDLYSTPNFKALAADGVKAQWMQPCFISKTFPNHYCIATGLYAESHGIVGNEFYDPIIGGEFDMKDTAAEWWDTGANPIWVLNQEGAADRHSGGMMWPGTNARIRGQTTFSYTSSDRNMSWSNKLDIVIGWFNRTVDPVNLALLYFDGADGAGHGYGPESIQVQERVELMDFYLGCLIQKLQETGLYDNMNLVVVSDHGMAPVLTENVIEVDTIIDRTLYTVYGDTPVWNIQPNPGYEDFVYNTLLNASQTYEFEIYKKEDIPAEYHYQNSIRISPLLLVANENYDIQHTKKTYLTNVHGTHGYNNSVTTMRTIFYARGPAFKKDHVIAPIKNIDLFSLFSEILQLTPAPNNGSLANVADALLVPPTNMPNKGYAAHGETMKPSMIS